MAGNYTQLKNDIIDYVKQNGDNLITGNGLQGQLLAMVNSLGAGYQYMGVARLTPTPTDPGTPDQKVFYIAAQPGDYPNFGTGITVAEGEVAVLKWDTAWHKEVTGAATAAQVTELGQKIDDLALGKFYGFFPAAAGLPAGDDPGYAYVGASSPFAIYMFKDGEWSDSGSVYQPSEGNGEDIDTNEQGKLQFANRPTTYGMGYKILRRNKTFAEQVTDIDTIYEIRYDFDLGGASVTIPAGCVLKFNGGKLSHGTLVGNGTIIIAANYKIFTCESSKYRGYYYSGNYSDFRYVEENNGLVLSGTWSNTYVGSNWCGLQDIAQGTECSRAINNHLLLFAAGVPASIPCGEYTIYGRINARKFTDFQNSKFVVVADYSTITDNSIAIPDGAEATPLRSLYGFVSCNQTGGYMQNLTLDCNSINRTEPYSTFGSPGVAAGISFAESSNFMFKNLLVLNAKQSAYVSNNVKDCVFDNMSAQNCGEHGIYFHFNEGSFVFKNCTFIDYSNDPELISIRGASACLRFTGPSASGNMQDYAAASLLVENCVFSATLNARVCYGPAPQKITFKGCSFKRNNGMIQYDGSGFISLGLIGELYLTDCFWDKGLPPASMQSSNVAIYMDGCRGAAFTFMIRSAKNCELVERYVGTNPFVPKHDLVEFENCKISYQELAKEQITFPSPAKISILNSELDTACSHDDRGQLSHRISGAAEFLMHNVCWTHNEELWQLYGASLKKISLTGCKVKQKENHDSIFFSLDNNVSGAEFYCVDTFLDDSICTNAAGMWLGNLETRLSKFVCEMTAVVFNRYYKRWSASAKDGGVIVIPGFRYYGPGISTSFDLTPYIRIVPKGNFANFTWTVTNNGGASNSFITISNGSETAIPYDLELDLRYINF